MLYDTQMHEMLGLSDEPFGMFYTNTMPKEALFPQAFTPIREQLAATGTVDLKATRSHFSCVIGKLWLARKKHSVAAFSADRYGCTGGSFFMGFHQPQIDAIARFVSTGFPGTPMHGERYLDSPATSHRFFEACMPPPAPADFCVCKPLSLFTEDEIPLVVMFFARGEVLGGLCTLTAFVTGDPQSVTMPFGAGCANLIAWPLRYLAQNKHAAVMGGADPSCRPYLKTDEMTFTVPYAMYQDFCQRWEDSFLKTDTWGTVRKKITRSKATWNDA